MPRSGAGGLHQKYKPQPGVNPVTPTVAAARSTKLQTGGRGDFHSPNILSVLYDSFVHSISPSNNDPRAQSA